MSNQAFYDEAFSQIAQRAGNLSNLLDEFFDFLHRRTDFYVTFPMPTDSESGRQYKMGFPEGKAEQMVISALRKRKFKDYLSVVGTEPPIAKDPVAPAQKTAAANSSSRIQPKAEPRLNEFGKQIPIGNGGVSEKYYWTQTLTDVTIYVDAPIGIKSKAIRCDFTSKTLLLALQDEIVIDGSLDDVIRPNESMWTISKGKDGDNPQIVITLEKSRETWWSRIVAGDPEIDTNKVDSSKNINDYDGETQAAIRKIVHEQRTKLMGGKTQEEMQMEEIMNNLPNPPL